jgi:hypothetical protein
VPARTRPGVIHFFTERLRHGCRDLVLKPFACAIRVRQIIGIGTDIQRPGRRWKKAQQSRDNQGEDEFRGVNQPKEVYYGAALPAMLVYGKYLIFFGYRLTIVSIVKTFRYSLGSRKCGGW